MIAYKATRKDMTCTLGTGVFQFRLGETVREEGSKCASRGLHCAEYPLDCLNYYPLHNGNRYFQVEASGSLDEDGRDSKIACTEMTLIRELDLRQLTGAAMMYMIRHPFRDWKKHGTRVEVREEKAAGDERGSIVIARGRDPRARGAEGSVIGLVKEAEPGIFQAARLAVAGKDIRADVWYSLDENGEMKEI